MKKKLLLAVVILIGILLLLLYPRKEPFPALSNSMRQELETYIVKNYKTPEEYVLSKFKSHDIIFLGEYHRIKHDVELVQNLIPFLYEDGVYNLGIEFACYEDQDKIDQLLSAKTYNESLAYEIQFNFWPWWGYQEYIDIYKAAWDFNQQLPKDARKFRVVGLNGNSDWSYVKTEEDRDNPEIMKNVFKDGPGDQFMADVIIKEFLQKEEKALIFSGINHAYTKYKQPIYHEKEKRFVRFVDDRMGNIIYDKIGERCITIFLHSPWPSKDKFSEDVYPAEGVIDKLMIKIDEKFKPVGFDIKGTPFEKLPGKTSLWQHGYNNFNLGVYCDGYIYTKPLSKYKGVEVAPGFINENNRIEAIQQSANPKVKSLNRTVEELIDSIKRSANMQKRFKKFR